MMKFVQVLLYSRIAYPRTVRWNFGAMPSARTPFHAGVERAESAQGDSVTAGAWQGLTHYVYGPTGLCVCACVRYDP